MSRSVCSLSPSDAGDFYTVKQLYQKGVQKLRHGNQVFVILHSSQEGREQLNVSETGEAEDMPFTFFSTLAYYKFLFLFHSEATQLYSRTMKLSWNWEQWGCGVMVATGYGVMGTCIPTGYALSCH